jgi:hypothetical protein
MCEKFFIDTDQLVRSRSASRTGRVAGDENRRPNQLPDPDPYSMGNDRAAPDYLLLLAGISLSVSIP